MAQIYPQWIAEEERNSPGKRAEILLYDHLASQLSEKWLVIYGAAIKRKAPHGIVDRETEFIVGHPELGIVFIEVKGGSISCEGNIWYTTPLSQLDKPKQERKRTPLRKSPFDQVLDSAKEYERKFIDFVRSQNKKVGQLKFATAVCFPDIVVNSDLASNAPRELVIDRNDLSSLEQKLVEILKIHHTHDNPPGVEGLGLLRQLLARNWHLDSFLAYQVEDVEMKQQHLTEEQFRLLYDLQDNPRMLIRGCAGSGKTTLAAKKAYQLALLGENVLFVCFNENLSSWLNMHNQHNHANILISHFHGLIPQLAKQLQVNIPPFSDDDTYYKETLPNILLEIAIKRTMTFDAIIVDEGQDFDPAWIEILQLLLKDQENGVFWIFYDDNQRIYNDKKFEFPWTKFRLSRNMRNTDQIFSRLIRYYHQPDNVRSSGISGPEPWIVDLKQYPNQHDALQNVVARLVENKISLTDVVILTPRAKDKSVWGSGKVGKYKLVWSLNTFKGEISCCTIHRFKGLEKKVVILSELEYAHSSVWDELLYIGISRAKVLLISLGSIPAQKTISLQGK